MKSKPSPLKDHINLKKWLESIADLKKDSDKIFLNPEGEEILISIIEAEKQLQEIKDEIKSKLEQSALKLDPHFSSIQSDRVKVFYREYGSKYYVDESMVDMIPEGLINKEIRYQVDSKAVEKWSDDHKGLPVGIKEVERAKTLSFSVKNNGKTE